MAIGRSAGDANVSGLRVLVLARNYPNNAMPRLGLWTQRLTHCVAGSCEVRVLAPVPYAPPLPFGQASRYLQRFRNVSRRSLDGGVDVSHPRFLAGPGNLLRPIDPLLFGATVIPFVRWLRRDFPFDLIHAHFTFPDGVVASAVGRLFHVPTIVTEHAPWYPWIRRESIVRVQTIWAARACRFHVSVSESVRRQVVEAAGIHETARVIPNVVDPVVFHVDETVPRVPGQILFVGAIRNCKGVDVLFEALRQPGLADPRNHLLIAGEPLYEGYRREVEWLQERAKLLGIGHRITWLGGKTPSEVAALMRRSSVVVLPSRAESFGAVLIEAMACGTPVVATRCGGPEEVVAPETGRLVELEQPVALAEAIADVLANGDRYNPLDLHSYAIGRFGPDVVAARLSELYAEAVADAQVPGRVAGIRG